MTLKLQSTSTPKGQAVDFGEVLRRQRPLDRLHVLLELLRPRRAGDHARHVGLGGEPAEGELEQAAAVTLGEVRQPLDLPPVALSHVAVGEALGGGEPRALRWRRVALVLAGQKPARQREERQQPIRYASIAGTSSRSMSRTTRL